MCRNKIFLEYFLVFMFLLFVSFSVDAGENSQQLNNDQPAEVSLDEVSQGSLLFKTAAAGRYQLAVSQKTAVTMRINGPIARTRVVQTFSNPTPAWAEAVYAFPLPEKAAVDHLRMQVGERIIEGQIKERQQARQIYQAAKQAGKRSALVEQHRPNLFTTSVANIAPAGKVIITIEYQQSLRWTEQGFSLRFPMAITPRYKPSHATADLPVTQRLETSTALDGGWAILPGEIPNRVPLTATSVNTDADGQPDSGNTVSLDISLDAGFPLASVSSLYHAVTVENTGHGRRHIFLQDTAVKADRDFVLQWQPQADSKPQAAFFTETTDSGSYGLLMLMPPKFEQENAQIGREILFIIDTSGSMGGESIRQARRALQTAIQRLQPGEFFNVIQFNSTTAVLFQQALAATESNKRRALDYVGQLQAGGGTEMLPALRAAFAMQPDDMQRLQQIVFITDGAVGNEGQLLAYINAQLQQSAAPRRLFTIGIGSAPNSHFMTEAAYFGRGSYSYISRPEEVQQNMEELFNKLEHPVLTSLDLDLPVTADVLPNPLSDLYLGEPLVAIMKLDAIPASISLTGQYGRTAWRHNLALNRTQDHAGLSVYWAREKIRYWMRSKVRGEASQKVREAVLQIALQNHLVSQYTSLVAVDVTPVRQTQDVINKHALRGELPAGLQPGRRVQLARGATPSQLYLLVGLLLLLAAMSLHIVPRFRCRRVRA